VAPNAMNSAGVMPSTPWTLVSLSIGFALAAVGIDTVSGSVRLTMGIDELVKGINFVVAVMGLFGIGELLIAVEDEFHVKAISSKVEWREVFRTLIGLPRYGWVLLRSAAIGIFEQLARVVAVELLQECGRERGGRAVVDDLAAAQGDGARAVLHGDVDLVQ